MEQPPAFLTSPLKLSAEETYQPTQIPRRGGVIAWIATVLIAIAAFVLYYQSGHFPCLTILLFIFFLLAAIMITFNHWVDSKTIIRITPSQISYQSPFRQFLQTWDQITDVKAIQAGHSWRIWVNGNKSFFSTRVGTEQISESRPEKILELPHGERLLRLICGMSNLSEIEKIEEGWRCRRTTQGSVDESFLQIK